MVSGSAQHDDVLIGNTLEDALMAWRQQPAQEKGGDDGFGAHTLPLPATTRLSAAIREQSAGMPVGDGLPRLKANVGFGSKADIGACITDVRLTPKSGHFGKRRSCPLSGHSE